MDTESQKSGDRLEDVEQISHSHTNGKKRNKGIFHTISRDEGTEPVGKDPNRIIPHEKWKREVSKKQASGSFLRSLPSSDIYSNDYEESSRGTLPTVSGEEVTPQNEVPTRITALGKSKLKQSKNKVSSHSKSRHSSIRLSRLDKAVPVRKEKKSFIESSKDEAYNLPKTKVSSGVDHSTEKNKKSSKRGKLGVSCCNLLFNDFSNENEAFILHYSYKTY